VRRVSFAGQIGEKSVRAESSRVGGEMKALTGQRVPVFLKL